MDQYKNVIELYDRLCVERNDSTFWAANILDASQGITSKIVWQNFYAYMANENHVFTDTWQDSLGEQVDKGLSLKEGGVTFKTKTVQNGNITIIRMTPENFVLLIKRMANPWLAFLKQYRKKHPSMSLKQAMKSASSEYKKAPKKSTKKKSQKSRT